jgi:ribosomal protein S18 acetylase RimI-like enzyme
MEIASTPKLLIRPATRGDTRHLLALFQSAKLEHKHADWSFPVDWIGSPGFLVCEQLESDMNDEIVACFAAAADPLPSAWVRLAAVRNGFNAEAILKEMATRISSYLKGEGVSEIGWLQANSWPENLIASLGFEIANWIITYVKFGIPAPGIPDGRTVIRKAAFDDIEQLADIEVAAFDSLWRHSADSLRAAYYQALCFDVVYLEEKLVGFHYSVSGIDEDTAHLVRITVHPDAQRRGVGSALMEHALQTYKKLGISNVTLNTQLDNVASHHLYEKFGFRRLGERIPLWLMDITIKE